MCFAAIAIGAALASAAASAYGGYVSAQGAKAQGSADAAQDEYNARVAEHNAENVRREATAKNEFLISEAGSLQASQRAAAAASGRNPDIGSPALLLADTDKNRQLDTMANLWSARTRSDALTHEAQGQRLAGANAKRASRYAAAGSFLSGLGSAAGSVGQAASLRIKT